MLRLSRYFFVCLMLFSLFFESVLPAAAHIIPTVTHKVTIDAKEDKSTFDLWYYYDPIIVTRFLVDFDSNSDASISDEEKSAWIKKYVPNIKLSVNEKPIELLERKIEIPSYNSLINDGGPVHISGFLPTKFNCNSSTIFQMVDNNIFMAIQDDIYTFLVNKSGCLTVQMIKDKPNELIAYIGKSGEIVSSTTQKADPKSTQTTQEKISQITNVLRDDNNSQLLFFWALGISFVLGALHALTPGHGKTLVAAYLVGQHGTKKDAFILALMTTITHTSSIYILGFISIFATSYFLPEKIIPALEAISALSIFGLGIWLLSKRLDEYKHGHSHHGDHEHTHDNHDHVHTLDDLKGRKVTLASLISLGFSGGIVPCVDALAIMIVAIGINKIPLGMILIFFFSMGLAAVLVVLGIALVSSKKLFEKYAPSNGSKVSRFLPIISAIIITGIGAVLVLKILRVF
jgi:nickel/cobalt transporter (NicO) family protein